MNAASDHGSTPARPAAPRPLTPRAVRLGGAFYLALSVVGAAWCALAGRANLFVHPEPRPLLPPESRLWLGLAAAAALTLASSLSSLWLLRHAGWGARLHRLFAALLQQLGPADRALLAIASSTGEEVFFRGAMQPDFGLWLTAALFGLLHGGLSRELWPWAAWAAVMGLCLGGLFEFSGSLIPSLFAHAAINYLGMLHFARRRAVE